MQKKQISDSKLFDLQNILLGVIILFGLALVFVLTYGFREQEPICPKKWDGKNFRCLTEEEKCDEIPGSCTTQSRYVEDPKEFTKEIPEEKLVPKKFHKKAP